MNRLELKTLVKETIKERYGMESDKELPDFIKKILSKNDGVSISKGYKDVHSLLKLLNQSKNGLLTSLFKKDMSSYKSNLEKFNYYMDQFKKSLLLWSYKIAEKDMETEKKLKIDAESLEEHLFQIKTQLGSIIINSTRITDLGKPNYINAMKENEHLNEIFIALSQLVDKIFGYNGIK